MNTPMKRPERALDNLVNSIKPCYGSILGTGSFTDSHTAQIEYGKAKSNLHCIYNLLEALHEGGGNR